jgi:hypothetical protein
MLSKTQNGSDFDVLLFYENASGITWVACIIFALPIFSGNDLLYNLIVCKCFTIL